MTEKTAFEIHPNQPVILATVPVLIPAERLSEQEGTVVDQVGNPRGVRVLKEGDVIGFYRSQADDCKQQFVAIAHLLEAFRRYNRSCSSRSAQKDYQRAIRDYEGPLAKELGESVLDLPLGHAILKFFPDAASSPQEAAAIFDGRVVPRSIRSDPNKTIIHVLSSGLKDLRPVLWESSRGILPGLLADKPETALRADLVLQILPAAGAGWAVCAHPSCRELFRWKGKPLRYCCREHGEAYRSASYRKTLKGRRAARRAAQKRKARQESLLVPKRRVAELER